MDRDARTSNRARIVIDDDTKKSKKEKKARKQQKKDRKEKKRQKKERKRARRENEQANVSPLEEMVNEENAKEKCAKCAMRAP